MINKVTFEFSMTDVNSTKNRRKKKILYQSSTNLFHKPQRNLSKLSDTTLPMITSSSLSNFHRMSTKKSSSITSTPYDIHMAKIKTHIRNINHDNIQHSSNQQTTIRNLSNISNKKISTDLSNQSLSSNQVSLQSHNQYGHFLAYLRRKSLARQHRKREEQQGYTHHIETTLRYNLMKQSSSSPSSSILFQSTSNHSSISFNTNLSSITTQRNNRLSTSFHTLSQMNKPSKIILDDPLLSSSSLLITPRNSVVDDEISSPIIKPFEFYLNDDKLQSKQIQNSNRNKHHHTSIVYI